MCSITQIHSSAERKRAAYRGQSVRYATLVAALVTVVTGCGRQSGPELVGVSGTVTLDGKPLADASITFQPIPEGRPSVGVTDSSGNFTLLFSEDRQGALPGSHLVRISTWREGYDDGTWHPQIPEQVPDVYNVKASQNALMTKTVEGGSAQIDFQLSSKAGKVVQRAEPKTRRSS